MQHKISIVFSQAECTMLRFYEAHYQNSTKYRLTRVHSSMDKSDSIVQLGKSRNMTKHRISLNVKM